MIYNILYFLLAAFLIITDKLITVKTLTIAKNKYKKRYLSLEKNMLQRWFFQKYGLSQGAVYYSYVSMISFIVSVFLLHWPLKIFTKYAFGLSFAVVSGIYIIAIINNIRWYLKYKQEALLGKFPSSPKWLKHRR